MAAYLDPVDQGTQIPIDKAVILIGRHPDCDVVLTCSRKVSRKHCCVVQVNDHYVVRDLGSMNGLRVNDADVVREAPLGAGDELTIGDVRFKLVVGANGNGGVPMKFKAPAKAKRRAPTPVTPIDPQRIPDPEELQPAEPAPRRVITPATPNDLSQDYPVPIDDDLEEVDEASEDDYFEFAESDGEVVEAEAPSVDFMPVADDVSLFDGDIEDVIILDDDDE